MNLEAEKRLTEKRAVRRMATFISEVILENFMSYEYARIPLKKGLNVICGPNGAGKSSLLLAISVALGQAYTERSRKLSDLIRRGKDTARVSLIFDNRPVDGRRPISFSRSDTFMLSRYLKRDGSYWYEADYREISKNEVVRLFNRAGINPDNMLIIMHQGMVEEFSVTTPQEKLKMVEEAVGFKEYRERVIDAEAKLAGLVSEEGPLAQIIESAGQTVEYWKGLYDRYLLKKSLRERQALLERELIWAYVAKHEAAIKDLQRRLEGRESVLKDILEEIEKTGSAASETSSRLQGQQTEVRKLYFTLMRLEKEKAISETTRSTLEETRTILKETVDFLRGIPLPSEGGRDSKEIERRIESLQYTVDSYSGKIQECGRRVKDVEGEIGAVEGEIGKAEKATSTTTERYIDLKVSEAILEFKKKNVQREISDLKRGIKDVEKELEELSPQLEKAQPRIDTTRTPTEVSEEMRINAAHLKTVEDVPDEAEKMYTDYTATFEELKEKLQTVTMNKEAALKEVEERKKIWRSSIQEVLIDVNPLYQDILSKIGATGFVKLADSEDLESAGLELWVGFRGSSPTVLDAYTQSGGERSVSVIAFLLSLQRRVISPFRAVDEFDVHMDPRNREAVFKVIFPYVREDPETQYIVITPSQLTVARTDIHLLFVQNVQGRSELKEVNVGG